MDRIRPVEQTNFNRLKFSVYGDPGCIEKNAHVPYTIFSPDGKLQNCKGGTIEHLYRRFNGIVTKGKGYYQRHQTIGSTYHVPSMDEDGSIRVRKIAAVLYSGLKVCVQVKTKGGLDVVCTPDHPFATLNGYIPIQELGVGGKVLVHLSKRWTTEREKKLRTNRPEWFVKSHPFGSEKVIVEPTSNKGYVYKRISRARGVYEAALNNLTPDQYRNKLNGGILDGLLFVAPGMDIHHIDENPLNDVIENLVVLTHEDHAKTHAVNNFKYIASEDEIVSIEAIGERETYDIQMESAPHNFVTERFIVHNTGKTRFSCTFPKPLLLIAAEKGTDSIVGMQGVDVFPLERTEEVFSVLDHVVNGSKYKTIVLDTATKLRKLRIAELFQAMGKEVPKTPLPQYAGKEWKDVWQGCSSDLQKILTAVLSIPDSRDISIVINSHEANLTYDDGSSSSAEFLRPNISSAVGKAVGDFLNAEVSYMGQMLIRDKFEEREEKMGDLTNTVKVRSGSEYVMRVGPDAIYRTKFRRPLTVTKPLPDFIVDPSYEKIIKVIKGEY